jgi:hypothetical protein
VTTNGTVRAVGIRDITDSAAQVVAVVEQTPVPPDEVDDDNPSDLILALGVVRDDGQWKMTTISAVT